MRSVARVIHAELILILMLTLTAPAFAAQESGPVGPYNVSFDINTTEKYTVIVEAPSSGITSQGVNFTRYNLTVDSTDYFLWLILTRYEELMLANITANEDIVRYAFLNVGVDEPTIYRLMINEQPYVLGNFRFANQNLGEGRFKQGDLIVAASYSPDGRVYEDGVYQGKTQCAVISTFPWEVIRDMLNSLRVVVPIDERAPTNQSQP